MNKNVKIKGRQLTYALRHAPESIDISLETLGAWALVEKVLSNLELSIDELNWIVDNDSKMRFSFSEDRSKIRANQGHSLDWIVMDFDIIEPPEKLFHGTSEDFLEVILEEGLKKMSRTHVHLSSNLETASQVGSRHGPVTILEVNTKQMYLDGIKFYLSKNNVWLVDYVHQKYLTKDSKNSSTSGNSAFK